MSTCKWYSFLVHAPDHTLVAALDPSLKADGQKIYLSDCQLVEAAPWAVNSEAAEKLWKLSEKLVGETLNLA